MLVNFEDGSSMECCTSVFSNSDLKVLQVFEDGGVLCEWLGSLAYIECATC